MYSPYSHKLNFLNKVNNPIIYHNNGSIIVQLPYKMCINEVAIKQIEVIREKCKAIKPVVIIWCTAYNHERYLKDTLEGFIKQTTDFPFVAIVHEDFSTDVTADILKDYTQKYPDIIFPIFEKENQYSKADGSLERIMDEVSKATGAKYVALCEGDDYWIDPLKLQKQVDFLENNPDYGLVHSNVYESFWYDDFKSINFRKRKIPEGLVYKELLKRNFLYTLTVLFRSELMEILKNEVYPLPYLDRILWICFSRHTKFHYIDECLGVYRTVKNSATHGDYGDFLRWDENSTHALMAFLTKNNTQKNEIDEFYLSRCRRLLKYSSLSNNKKKAKEYWNYIKEFGSPSFLDIGYFFWGKLGMAAIIHKGIKHIKRYKF